MSRVLQPHCSAESSPGLFQVNCYCLLVSSSFVGSLYTLVPSRVRELDRDHPSQIQWRTVATSIACLGAVAVYPAFVCEELLPARLWAAGLPGVVKAEIFSCGGVVVHVSLLYLGPHLRNAVAVRKIRHATHNSSPSPTRPFLEKYYQIFFGRHVSALTGSYGSSERWMALRNLIVAPVLEEIAFRGCIVSALRSEASLSIWEMAMLAPLWFGVAHVHHAWLCLRRGQPPAAVALQTLFQLAYTSLFGSYATWVFLRTRSLLAAALAHSYCNAMGLPDGSFFWHGASPLHAVRWWLLGAHGVGLAAFVATMEALVLDR